MKVRPLGVVSRYSSIKHIQGSRMQSDDSMHPIQLCERFITPYDQNDGLFVYAQEKLDGANVGITLEHGRPIALTRAGYKATGSNYLVHSQFAKWVANCYIDFTDVISPGEILRGEWLGYRHSLSYSLDSARSPFYAFDIMHGKCHMPMAKFMLRCAGQQLLQTVPQVGNSLKGYGINFASAWQEAKRLSLCESEPEGLVFRLESEDSVHEIGKWVRHDFVPGEYLKQDIKMWDL